MGRNDSMGVCCLPWGPWRTGMAAPRRRKFTAWHRGTGRRWLATTD